VKHSPASPLVKARKAHHHDDQDTPFDPAQYLDDEQSIADYLTAMLEDGNPGLLAAALGDIARARGMAQITQDAGMGREALYKALRADAQPRFETIARVCKALGVHLVAEVAHS
jgi:probable addiction module antidote protein